MSDNKDLITAQVLAEALDLSVETIWRYTRESKIPYILLGSKSYRYKLADVIRALTNPIVQENACEYGSEDTKKRLTYQDYLLLPEEAGYRFEILDGMLVREPSPNVIHQRVSRRLQRILEDYFREFDSEGEIFNAPLDLTFHDTTVVQPDLFYVSGAQKMIVKNTRIDGPPTLIVEILSPSSIRKDRLQKLRIYQEVPVQHYWMVNPEEKTLECLSMLDGLYAIVATGMDEDVVNDPAFTGLSIPLKALWYPG